MTTMIAQLEIAVFVLFEPLHESGKIERQRLRRCR